MKHLIFLFSLIVILASCSKNTNDLRVDMSKLEFKIDGVLKQYQQTNAAEKHMPGVNVYTFTGANNPTGQNYFVLTFTGDNVLHTGTYSASTGVVQYREGNTFASNVSTEFTVTITSNDNGLISGSFKGSVLNSATNHNCTIIEGLIENIQLTN